MARFCTKCGKPLEEGEVCSCTQQAEPVQQTETAQQTETVQQAAQPVGSASNNQQTQQAVAGILGRTFGGFLNVVRHPVTEGRDMILRGDSIAAIILMVLQAIVTTIFGVIAAKEVYSAFNMLTGSWGSIFGSYSDEIHMPYFKIILGTLLISIVLSFVLALLLFLGNLIIRNTLSFQQMLGAVAIRSCMTIITSVIAIIVFFINPGVGMLLFITGTVWGFFVILLAMPLANEKMRNKLPLMMFLVFLIFAGVTLFSMGKGAGLYVPSGEDTEYYSDWLE